MIGSASLRARAGADLRQVLLCMLPAALLACTGNVGGGGTLAFVSPAGEGPSIMVFNRLGKAVPLCSQPARRGGPMALSPGGEMLAYVEGDPTGMKLHIARGDCSQDRVLEAVNGTIADVTFSPDGTRVAFVEFRTRPAAGPGLARRSERTGDWEVMVSSLEGPPVPFDLPNSDERSPAWSTDGTLAFLSTLDSEAADLAELHVSERGTAPPRAITRGAQLRFRGLAWFPDGQRLVATQRPGSNDTLVAVSLQGAVTPLVSNAAAAIAGAVPGAALGAPAVSPNGKLLAFEADQRTYNATGGRMAVRVFRMNAVPGATPELVTDGMARCPAFSPDGKRLAFVVDRQATADLASSASAGGSVSTLASPGGCPAWAPAKRRS